MTVLCGLLTIENAEKYDIMRNKLCEAFVSAIKIILCLISVAFIPSPLWTRLDSRALHFFSRSYDDKMEANRLLPPQLYLSIYLYDRYFICF